MGADTKIEWCDFTFNCWRGCTKVSPGCAHCYADAQSKRNPSVLGVWGPNGTRVVASESMWAQPLKWDKAAKAEGVRKRVFCASLADVFEDWKGSMAKSDGSKLLVTLDGKWTTDRNENYPRIATMHDVRNRLFALIDATPNLDWLLLTKRPENITKLWPGTALDWWPGGWSNVWLGTSVENQDAANNRIPHLLNVPAKVRFLSCEPLLGPVDLTRWLKQSWCQYCGQHYEDPNETEDCPRCGSGSGMIARHPRSPLHWVIVGGESGPHARPMNVAWVRSIVEQCKAAGVACFVKQMGASFHEDSPSRNRQRIMLRDPKGGDISEFPTDLQVRGFPNGRS